MASLQIFRALNKSTPCLKTFMRPAHNLRDIKHENLTITKTTEPRLKPASSEDLIFGSTMSDHMLIVNWSFDQGWDAPKIVPFNSLEISPASSVLHYGLGCFEGMKAFNGEDGNLYMFRPEENIKRLCDSATRLALPQFDKVELLKCVSTLVCLDREWVPTAAQSSLYIRPTVIGTEPTLGVRQSNKAMLFVIMGPVGPYFTSGTFTPISLLAEPQFVRAWPGGIGYTKAGGNYAPTLYALKMAESKGCSQCLWLYNDEVTEVGTMNIFLYWINEKGEEELITPPLNGLILPGITRMSLLEISRQWGEFKVTEESFTIQQLVNAANEGRVKELFGAGTACVVSPVDKVLYNDEFVKVDTPEGFPLAKRLYTELTDIQCGRKPHPWSYLVEAPN